MAFKKKKERKAGSHKEGHKIRKSCKLCNNAEVKKNTHRFHGYGSFKNTHIGYCKKKKCCAQNISTCYSEGQKRRKKTTTTRKRKTKKT